MQQVIYVDVLIVLNTVITFILLLCVRQFTGCATGSGRLVAASLVGGVYSLIILAPPMNLFLTLLTKAAVGLSIAYIAFRATRLRHILRSGLLFLGMSFLFAGVLYAVTLTGTNRLTYNNGFGYMELSLPALVALCVALYLVILLLRKKVFLAKEQDAVYRMELFYKENSFRGSALLDTGNGLRNAYSDSEVILLTEDAAKSLTGFRVTADVAKMSDLGLPVRLLPVKALSAEKLLPAFTAEKLIVYDEGVRREVQSPCVAVTDDPLGRERYQALLSGSFFERREYVCSKN